MATQETRKPPPFYCPKCGQKHRADLTPLRGKAGSVMRAVCKGCGEALGVSLDAHGQPRCLLLEDAEREAEGRTGAQPEAKVGSLDVHASETREAPVQTTVSAESLAKAPEPPAEEFPADTQLGRYTVQEVIGRGGTGTVYRAFDPTTNRTVALKVLNHGLSDTMHQRFLREIEVQANIRHQNIMPVFDRGELPDGRPYFTMELLYSPLTLTEVIDLREQGKLHRNTALRDLEDMKVLVTSILIPICEGIHVANVENGVVHRDLKPDNALVDSRTHRPYVIDFGICQVLEDRKGLSTVVQTPATEDAGIVGTPRFLSPEQARGSVHARTDVWGLGGILHFAVSGEPPIAAATPLTRAQIQGRIEALKEARKAAMDEGDQTKVTLCDEKLGRLQTEGLRALDDIFRDARDGKYSPLPVSTPPPLAAIIRKAMAPSPPDRYVNARQLAADLQAWVDGGKVRAVAEFGGTAAAVAATRRAVRRSLVAGLWVLAGLAAGLVLGFLLGGPKRAPAGTDPLEVTQRAVESLKAQSDQLAFAKAQLDHARTEADRAIVPPESSFATDFGAWKALDVRGQDLAARVAALPDSDDKRALATRLDFVRSRFAPTRVLLDVPKGATLKAQNALTGEAVTVKAGENALPPGIYGVVVGDAKKIRFPVRVPLVIRGDQDDPKTEAAAVHVEVPVDVARIPDGSVLVVGGLVRARNLPYSEPTTPTVVKAFLADRREVTNADYAKFLASLSDAERAARIPKRGFTKDATSTTASPLAELEDRPVVAIRPEDARAYAAWRGKRDSVTVRLPTEAEWALMAGGAEGWILANGFQGGKADGGITGEMQAAGANPKDVGDRGVAGLFGNAREMVTGLFGDVPEGGVLVKGAAVGDQPDAGAIHLVREMKAGERDDRTGFRCVTELKP